MPGLSECGMRFGQRMPPRVAPEAKCAHCALAIFKHQTQASDPAVAQPMQMTFDCGQIMPPDQTAQFRPSNRIILTDRRPGRPGLGHEIRNSGRHPDPWKRTLGAMIEDGEFDFHQRIPQ